MSQGVGLCCIYLLTLTAPRSIIAAISSSLAPSPVSYTHLTTDTIEQAIERAGTKAGNKGYDCATSAIEMVNLIRQIEA